MATYFCGADEASKTIIAAGLANGTIRPWAYDRDGRQWFTDAPLPVIHGADAEPEIAEEVDEAEDENLASLSDDELQEQIAALEAADAEAEFNARCAEILDRTDEGQE